jgi:hypothetical protein
VASVIANPEELYQATTAPVRISMNVLNGAIATNFAQTPTVPLLVFVHLGTP